MTRFEPTADVGSGAWIAPRLGGGFGAVGRVCPTGYEAYARIFHPADGDRPTTWAAVCAATGRIAHPLMQWHRISRDADGVQADGIEAAGRGIRDPATGCLGPDALATLAGALGADAALTVGLWHGYGFAYPHRGPMLALPMREYVLYRGRLATLRDPGWLRTDGWAWAHGRTPNLVWPDDRSWFVASEIDFDSTVVGGSRALIERVLSSGLEAAGVTAASDLSSEGDRLNP